MAGQYDEFERLIQSGEVGTAEKLLFGWIQSHPNDAHAWLLYGKCATSPYQKRSCFNRVLVLDPNNSEVLELLRQIDLGASAPPTSTQSQNSNRSASPNTIRSLPGTQRSAKPPQKTSSSDKNKARLLFSFYSLLHIMVTFLLGSGLVFMLTFLIPGLFDNVQTSNNFQRNWISNSPNASQELQNLAGIFLNPSSLNYKNISTSKELDLYANSITIDPANLKIVEFQGVSFSSQLMGGSVMQRSPEGQPLVIVMSVLFDEIQIPVIYYGPVDTFNYQDTLLIQGVYIEEANAIVAQHVGQLATKIPPPLDDETLLMLKAALIVVLWIFLCASIFMWKINLKRWSSQNPILFLPKSFMPTLIILSILLTSCTIDLSTTLEKDGSGITSVFVHESRDNLKFLRSVPGFPGYMSAVITQVKESGAMFEQYIDGDQEVFYLQRYLNTANAGSGSTYPSRESWVYVQRYREGNDEVLRFLAVVDTRTLYNNASDLGADVAGALRDELNKIDMVYHLSIPGKLVYHNGKEEANRQLSWQLRMNDVNYLVAEARFPNESVSTATSYSFYIWIGLGVIFVIATIFLISSIWIRPATKKTGRVA